MKITVSICCITYNHEKYIERALESFVMQETDFLYEIIIHDDASTDKTREIIKRYQKIYPNIIKPIFQPVNQYSRGVPFEELYLYPKVKGKYIAFCEGDDYWTDPLKLQKQVEFMESHPECSLSMHGAVKVRNENEEKSVPFCASPVSRYYSTEELISEEFSFSTNTMLFLSEHVRVLPDFFRTAPVTDYPLVIWLSLKGKVFYMKDIMAAYRTMADRSWTQQLLETPGMLETHFKEMEGLLNKIDAYTNGNYTDAIQQHILENRLHLYKILYNLKGAKSEELKAYYDKLTVAEKAKLYVGHYFPASIKISHMVKGAIHPSHARNVKSGGV